MEYNERLKQVTDITMPVVPMKHITRFFKKSSGSEMFEKIEFMFPR